MTWRCVSMRLSLILKTLLNIMTRTVCWDPAKMFYLIVCSLDNFWDISRDWEWVQELTTLYRRLAKWRSTHFHTLILNFDNLFQRGWKTFIGVLVCDRLLVNASKLEPSLTYQHISLALLLEFDYFVYKKGWITFCVGMSSLVGPCKQSRGTCDLSRQFYLLF